MVYDSLTHTSNNCRTPADPHTHLNNKNTHLTVFRRCKYHRRQPHKNARSDWEIKRRLGSLADTHCHRGVCFFPFCMYSPFFRPSRYVSFGYQSHRWWMTAERREKMTDGWNTLVWLNQSVKTGGMPGCPHGVWFTAQGHTWEDSSNNNNNRFWGTGGQLGGKTQAENVVETESLVCWAKRWMFSPIGTCHSQQLKIGRIRIFFIILHSFKKRITSDSLVFI